MTGEKEYTAEEILELAKTAAQGAFDAFHRDFTHQRQWLPNAGDAFDTMFQAEEPPIKFDGRESRLFAAAYQFFLTGLKDRAPVAAARRESSETFKAEGAQDTRIEGSKSDPFNQFNPDA